jgi:mannose-1-phosphate guanylyltransferase
MVNDEHLWAVVLAAGSGVRVSALTSSRGSSHVPKQYCSFGRQKPMLRWALDRAMAVVPAERVVTVVAEEHRSFWEVELLDLPAENVVVQPANRGTGVGVLLPFLKILTGRDPGARILVMPSDHYVAAEPVLRRALLQVIGLPNPWDERLVLLGMTPTDFDPEYGWIVPSPTPGGAVWPVAGFVEKPDRQTAGLLRRRGALLNTLIFAADASALLGIFEEAQPDLLRVFLGALRAQADAVMLRPLYESLPVVDFSRDVLERSPRHLSVLRVGECGWSDLGTPERVQLFMSRQGRPRSPAPMPPRAGPQGPVRDARGGMA